MVMKRKLTSSSSSSSYSYVVRRRLMKKRVKAALLRAVMKKKKQQQQDQDQVDEACSPEVQQRVPGPVLEEGGFLECVFGFFLNGEFVQQTRGFLVNMGAGLPPYYFPVVDNHGFLLGEFRKLDDDLNLVQEEDKNPVSYTSFLPPGLNF